MNAFTSHVDSERTTAPTIPMPIVAFNRWMLVVGIVSGLLLQQPLMTTAVFVIVLGAVLFGPKGSLVFQIGRRLLARQNARARGVGRVEDRRLMRFNNLIALVMLGLAQVAFVLGWTVAGWILASMVALAAAIALAGFCLGCFLYFQFKMARFRFFG